MFLLSLSFPHTHAHQFKHTHTHTTHERINPHTTLTISLEFSIRLVLYMDGVYTVMVIPTWCLFKLPMSAVNNTSTHCYHENHGKNNARMTTSNEFYYDNFMKKISDDCISPMECYSRGKRWYQNMAECFCISPCRLWRSKCDALRPHNWFQRGWNSRFFHGMDLEVHGNNHSWALARCRWQDCRPWWAIVERSRILNGPTQIRIVY
jgi:hypothetical protein